MWIIQYNSPIREDPLFQSIGVSVFTVTWRGPPFVWCRWRPSAADRVIKVDVQCHGCGSRPLQRSIAWLVPTFCFNAPINARGMPLTLAECRSSQCDYGPWNYPRPQGIHYLLILLFLKVVIFAQFLLWFIVFTENCLHPCSIEVMNEDEIY